MLYSGPDPGDFFGGGGFCGTPSGVTMALNCEGGNWVLRVSTGGGPFSDIPLTLLGCDPFELEGESGGCSISITQ